MRPAPLSIRAQLRWDVVRPIVEQLRPRRTIEVGVGQGAMGARIAGLSSESYCAVELDQAAFAKAKARIESVGGRVYNQPLSEIHPEAADLVCAFEVLEHIRDDEAALAEWCGFVAPGGHVLLSVPAHPERFGPSDVQVGHYRRYSGEQLRRLVENAGLVGLEPRLYGAPLGYALEAVRNRMDRRKAAGAGQPGKATPEELTLASGRTYQFDRPSLMSEAARLATVPFVYLQRVWPGGIGYVMLGRKPT